jgi:serine/threonine protein kinase
LSTGSSSAQLPCAFGKYELLEKIGVGGMAEVFRAKLPGIAGFEKTVVIKRLLPHVKEQDGITEMFVQEAKIAARVHHRNIVQVFELGEVSDELYISMEYIAGTDLSVLLRNAVKRKLNLPIWFSLHVMSEILSGLAAAHDLLDENGRRLNVVHRDVTPSNIFISYIGDIKLGDFGVATLTAREEPSKQGEIKGKVAYMSPEQLRAEHIDARTDVFAAGVVLWECLTKRRLFGGRPEVETMRAIIEGDRTPPSRYNPEIPKELDRVVLGALESDREERTTSASELQRQLLALMPMFSKQIVQSDVRQVVEVLLGQAKPGSSPTAPTREKEKEKGKPVVNLSGHSFIEQTPGKKKLKPFHVNPARPSLPPRPPELDIIIDEAPPETAKPTEPLPKASVDPAALTPAETPGPLADKKIADEIDAILAEQAREVRPPPAPPKRPMGRFDLPSDSELTPVQPMPVLKQPAKRAPSPEPQPAEAYSDAPPWQTSDLKPAFSSGALVADGGYRGPHPFWLQNEEGLIWGPCDYDTIRRWIGADEDRANRVYRVAGYQTPWVDLDLVCVLTGQEILMRKQPIPDHRRFAGSLRSRSLPLVLSGIWHMRATGRLVIIGEDPHQPPRRELHFVEGVPTYAATDVPRLQLPDLLLRHGLIEEEQLAPIMHEVLYRLETIEAAAGRYSSLDVENHYPLFMSERAVEMFYWRSGHFVFEPDFVGSRSRSFARSPLHLSLMGVSRMMNDGNLKERTAAYIDRPIQLAERFAHHFQDFAFTEEQARAVHILREGRPVAQLIKRYPTEERTLIMIAVLLVETGMAIVS